MHFSSGDLIVIALYFAVSLGAGFLRSRRASSSLSDYFLSGRSAPWWLVGTGMVATTFAADTPLWVAGKVGSHGISGNWLWWSAAAGGMLTVFFFARLWRRAGVLTDLEFIELRYGGRTAAFLRGFKAIYFGLFMNCIVLGWVNLAMLKIVGVFFPEVTHPELIVTGIALATLVYVAAAGLWGVMIADAFQFAVALGGCIILAIFAVQHPSVQDAGGLVSALPAQSFDFFPDFSGGETGFEKIALSAFLAYVMIQWWASWYPGSEPGGGGYIAQRIMSAKDERHGMLATLWFVIAHYCVRSWPWIIAALAAVVIYPDLTGDEREVSFVYLIRDVLPAPLRGLLVAAFLGAYMSTLSTHLNWGSSYVINDFYLRYFAQDGVRKDGVQNDSNASHILASRIVTACIAVLSLLVSFFFMDSVRGAWDFLLSITGGMGFVLILRWYWWRINAVSELVSMIAPLAALALLWIAEAGFGYLPPGAPENLYFVVPVSILVTLVAMFLSAPERREVLENFCRRVRPPGPGWKAVTGVSQPGLGRAFAGWAASVVLVYAALFLIGALLFEADHRAAILAVVGLVAAFVVREVIRREFLKA